MKPFRLNNLHILGVYLVATVVYFLYYLPLLPKQIVGTVLWYGFAFVVGIFF